MKKSYIFLTQKCIRKLLFNHQVYLQPQTQKTRIQSKINSIQTVLNTNKKQFYTFLHTIHSIFITERKSKNNLYSYKKQSTKYYTKAKQTNAAHSPGTHPKQMFPQKT